MTRRVVIDFENGTLEEVRLASRSGGTRSYHVRLMILESLLSDENEEDIASRLRVSIRTVERVRDRFNAGGITGIIRPRAFGRPRRMSVEEFKGVVLPLVNDPSLVNETHWTGVKLHGYLTTILKKEISYPTLLRYLHEEGYGVVVPRKWPERQDPEARKQFLSDFEKLADDPNNQIWFCDEAGFCGDPRPRGIWAKKGSRPKCPYLGDHIRASVIGAVQPDSGAFNALIFPSVDKQVFQAFLDSFAESTKDTDNNVILVLDNASWHKCKKLRWHHIKPLYLPAYSPDFNPIETVWRWIKEKFFTQWYAKSHDDLTARLCSALVETMKRPEELSSIASMKHLRPKT